MMKDNNIVEIERRTLSIEEGAKYLCISRAKLYELIKRRDIKSFKIDTRRLLDKYDLDEFIEQLKKEQ